MNNATTTYFISARLSLNEAPVVTGVPSSASVTEDVSSNVDLSAATFSDADGDNLTVTLSVGSGALAASSSGGVTVGGSSTALTLWGTAAAINTYLDTVSNIQYTTAANATGGVATLTVSAWDGAVGLASNPTVSINASNTPDVTGVTSSTANGHYKAGDVVGVQVNFDEAVNVTGTPTLTLETGATDRVATYSSGNGTSALTFTYTVQAGDTSADLDYLSTSALSLNGGTIKDSSNYNADLTLRSPGTTGSLAANKAIVIDTTNPVVTDGQISLSGATGTGGVFKVGDMVTASWNASSGNGDTNLSGSLGSVRVNFSAFGGGSAVAASLSGTTWSASYTIATVSTTGAALNTSVTATDAAGNSTTTADTTNATVDATPPVVTDANISISGASGMGGAFKIGDTVTATWNNTAGGNNNADIASVTVNFSQFGGGAAVAASNSGGTWTASYTIVAGAIDATSRNVSVTAIDTAGNSTTTADATNAVADNVAPTVTTAKISVSGATGNPNNSVFKIGDTVAVSWDNTGTGDNNSDTISGVTVDFSAFGGGSAVAASNSAGTWTASYTIPAGSILSATLQVSITATDNAGNVTTQIDDAASSADTVQTNAPAAVVLNDPSNSGSTTDTLTKVTKPTISGTSEPNATITVYVGGSQVGTATADGSGNWSYTFTTDLAEGSNSITTTATDYVGNTSTVSTALVLSIDTIAPAQPGVATLDSASDTGATADLLTYDTTPLIGGSAEANSTIEVFVGGVSVGTTTADGSGIWSFELAQGDLAEGAMPSPLPQRMLRRTPRLPLRR